MSRLGPLLALVVTAASCGGDGPVEAVRNDTGSIVEAGELSTLDAAVGDCFDTASGEAIDTLDAVPCEDDHDNEVFFVFGAPGVEFPGAAALTEIANETCADRFGEFVGLPYVVSELSFRALTPSEASWNDDDREIVCFLHLDGGQLAGSERDSER